MPSLVGSELCIRDRGKSALNLGSSAASNRVET
jgi:hypothetical protein